MYFIGYKWADDTPINETYFNGTDYDGIIYNIYKCSNTIGYWVFNHSYDFEFKLEENNNSSNMKEVFEFDWDGFKNGEFDVVLKNNEEANSFFNAMYDKYNIEHRTSYDEYFDFIERDAVFIKYNEYGYGKWLLDSTLPDKIVNWSDYMDKENTTETLKDTLDKSSVKRVLDLNVYNKIDNSQQDIKQAFVDIDTSVLYKTRELFDIIRDEKDIEKIRNILNIIDRLVITKNKVLNDFDSCMIDELNKE